MSTLTSQQTLRALCGHLYRPLRHPLRRPLRRPTGSVQAPFSGYDTLTQHFSPKATDSNGYVDIHDLDNAGDLELNNYDVRITDINERTLRTEISKALGIDYLAKATEADAKREIDAISGYLYGEGHRAMVPCVVSNGNKAYWVHFLVDTGAPITFLSEKACLILDLGTEVSTYATIAGCYHQIRMAPRKSHFADINILGADFCNAFKFMPLYLGNEKVKFVSKDRWTGPKDVFKAIAPY